MSLAVLFACGRETVDDVVAPGPDWCNPASIRAEPDSLFLSAGDTGMVEVTLRPSGTCGPHSFLDSLHVSLPLPAWLPLQNVDSLFSCCFDRPDTLLFAVAPTAPPDGVRVTLRALSDPPVGSRGYVHASIFVQVVPP